MTQGKRAGKRAGTRPRPQFRPALLLLALGITAAVVAWGYLVSAAIDFGTQARGGEGAAWAFLLLAAAGAMMCLFLGLLLVVRTARTLGLGRSAGRDAGASAYPLDPLDPPAPPAEPGGRRAAR